MAPTDFLKRLSNGDPIVVAEGYIFELERRGYLQLGAYVPDVVLKHPDVVRQLHEEFVHAGSDVVVALTYYGHREKMRLIGLEDKVEDLNRKALRIAREVAKSTGTLLAGNICNTNVYQRDCEESQQKSRDIFKEQIEWAVDEGVDFILAETFSELGEALLALECVKKYGKGVPVIVNLAPSTKDVTYDGPGAVSLAEACRQLEEAGAAVVGLNCARGPVSMLPLIKEVRKACKGPIACLPVTYRTNDQFKTMQSLRNAAGEMAFPVDLPAHMSSRTEIKEFAEACKQIGVQVVGLCCGSCSHYIRIVAEVHGRRPPGSEYSPDMSKHFAFGDATKFRDYHTKEFSRWYNGDA